MSRAPEELGSTARKIVDTAQEHLSSESILLDVGCGTGDLTIAIAESVASVHAIDSSPGMIEVAKVRANQQGAINADFAQGDLAAAANPGGVFTAVTVFNVLHYIEDVPETVRQIEKTLAPGGLFLSSTACLGERRSFLGALTWILTRLRIMPETHFFKQADLVDMITREGFEIFAKKKLSPLPEYFIVARKTA
ncbi:2-polyprenyl-6-hydroxyphenol methylase [Saliniradius amylolyticus]|uniref:2-polyprenyl-6-hydroxyphenol methylase n=2 Tax=Saliniradius amylolyticus TaxID=2183582 RepID=A0A2S2E1J0_9ALTE|nr:2-polyprenyl-6-hydroxyphenol methylase [Saliniradius amylolyticus]